ncbi:MAG: MFS transporter [Akkermansia sp.]
MYTLLLAIIYVAFVSTGLPDSLLGAAWPSMRSSYEVPLSYAGIISILVTVCIICSSLMAGAVSRRVGTPLVAALSVLLSALAMLGYAQADSFWELCLFSIPYGFAAGAIDTVLNNYVALNYSARHMSWLHAVWGVGASISPLIMSCSLRWSNDWQNGYWFIGGMQLVLATALLLSLPLWKSNKETPDKSSTVKDNEVGNWAALKTPGVIFVLLAFFSYGAIEIAASLWAASYLEDIRGLGKVAAAGYAGLFFFGVMSGRFLGGIIAPYCSERNQIIGGAAFLMLGALLLWLPVASNIPVLAGLLIVGMGGAPICPALFHAIPRYFGEANSMSITGLEMAFSYLGASLMPPLLGLVAEFAGLGIYPLYLAFWGIFVIFMMMFLKRSLNQV